MVNHSRSGRHQITFGSLVQAVAKQGDCVCWQEIEYTKGLRRRVNYNQAMHDKKLGRFFFTESA